jgi:tetratricopeptide (TPR) repeat protein
MSKLKVFTASVLLATTPSILVYPQYTPITVQIQRGSDQEQRSEKDYILSYDDMLRLLDEIESGELENKCTPEELERVKHFVAFLAKEGVLPDNSEESLSLDDDIEKLLNGVDNIYEDAVSFVTPGEYQYMIVPAVLNGHGEIVLCKSWLKKRWEDVKEFAKKHKKALIIGAAVVVAAAVVVVAVAASASAVVGAAATGAAGAAGAARSSDSDKKEQKEESSSAPLVPSDIPAQEAPMLKSAIDDQISSFKANIMQNQFFEPTNPAEQQGLSWEENGRALGSLFAHDSFNNLQHQIPYHPWLAQEIHDINEKYTFPIPGGNNEAGHPEIDRKFSTDYTSLYSNPDQQVDFNTLSYQVRGEKALSLGYYNQAVQDLGIAIEANPTNPIPYLERGIAHFGLGQYDSSLEDYKQFTSQAQKSNPGSASLFSIGFAKGLSEGVYESGEGLFLFMADFVSHPIQTSGQIVESVSTLVELIRKDEWGVVAEALSPEMHQLATQWDSLPQIKRGELAGYAVGKLGADILLPGGLAKVTLKSVKSAQELAAVCKNLQIAQKTLLLETAAGIGNSAKIAEVVRNGQTMMALGEELGFNPREIAQLKQARKLQGAIDAAFESLINKPGYEVLKAAINEERHVKFIIDYFDKPAKELQKSIKSLEKLIAEHKDKIANPSKAIPDWETLHPERKNALINKKWPTEIQCYTEQRDILQNILNQRIEK